LNEKLLDKSIWWLVPLIFTLGVISEAIVGYATRMQERYLLTSISL